MYRRANANACSQVVASLIKKKIKFSSYIRKFIMEQLHSRIYMTNGLLIYGQVNYLRISSYVTKPFLIYDFVTAPF